MCGRYVQETPIEEVLEFFDAAPADGLVESHRPSWNIPPTMSVLGIAFERSAERVGRHYRWGLVPAWAKELAIGNRAFNARAESVAEKPMFRAAFAARRLIVPADAYYEWQQLGERKKQPYVFRRRDGAPLGFAGIYETWREPEADVVVISCSIITTAASADIEIHDRMPVILEPSELTAWLDPSTSLAQATKMLDPAEENTLVRQAVSIRVGSSAIDSPELLEPLVNDDGEIFEAGQLNFGLTD